MWFVDLCGDLQWFVSRETAEQFCDLLMIDYDLVGYDPLAHPKYVWKVSDCTIE